MQRPYSLIATLTSDVYHFLLAAVNYGGENGKETKQTFTKPTWKTVKEGKEERRLQLRLQLIDGDPTIGVEREVAKKC